MALVESSTVPKQDSAEKQRQDSVFEGAGNNAGSCQGAYSRQASIRSQVWNWVLDGGHEIGRRDDLKNSWEGPAGQERALTRQVQVLGSFRFAPNASLE